MNTGRKIKDIFITFRNEIDNINPLMMMSMIYLYQIKIQMVTIVPLPAIEILEGCLPTIN